MTVLPKTRETSAILQRYANNMPSKGGSCGSLKYARTAHTSPGTHHSPDEEQASRSAPRAREGLRPQQDPREEAKLRAPHVPHRSKFAPQGPAQGDQEGEDFLKRAMQRFLANCVAGPGADPKKESAVPRRPKPRDERDPYFRPFRTFAPAESRVQGQFMVCVG